MDQTFYICDKLKLYYASIYFMKEIDNQYELYERKIYQNDPQLDIIAQYLRENGYVDQLPTNMIKVSLKGKKILKTFDQLYDLYTTEYSVFSAVDLKTKDFALRYYQEFHDYSSWQTFIEDTRWTDIRLAVIEHNNIDPLKIIFMNYVNQGLFGLNKHGIWTIDRILGDVWNEMGESLKQAHFLYLDRIQKNDKKDYFIKEIIEKATKLLSTRSFVDF